MKNRKRSSLRDGIEVQNTTWTSPCESLPFGGALFYDFRNILQKLRQNWKTRPPKRENLQQTGRVARQQNEGRASFARARHDFACLFWRFVIWAPILCTFCFFRKNWRGVAVKTQQKRSSLNLFYSLEIGGQLANKNRKLQKMQQQKGILNMACSARHFCRPFLLRLL